MKYAVEKKQARKAVSRSPYGGRGLKFAHYFGGRFKAPVSLPVWGAWIEIHCTMRTV